MENKKRPTMEELIQKVKEKDIELGVQLEEAFDEFGKDINELKNIYEEVFRGEKIAISPDSHTAFNPFTPFKQRPVGEIAHLQLADTNKLLTVDEIEDKIGKMRKILTEIDYECVFKSVSEEVDNTELKKLGHMYFNTSYMDEIMKLAEKLPDKMKTTVIYFLTEKKNGDDLLKKISEIGNASYVPSDKLDYVRELF